MQNINGYFRLHIYIYLFIYLSQKCNINNKFMQEYSSISREQLWQLKFLIIYVFKLSKIELQTTLFSIGTIILIL